MVDYLGLIFDVEILVILMGYWFILSNFEDVMVDENGMVVVFL